MKRVALAALLSIGLVSPVVFGQGQGQGQGQGVGNDGRGVPALAAEAPMLGVHWARDAQPGGQAGANPNLLWHSGAIMTTSTVTAIFWGPSWGNSSFVADKITGLQSWYVGVSESTFADTADEFTGTNGQVGSRVDFGGSIVDQSSVPGSVSSVTTPTANEVCKMIGSAAVPNGYYPVYVDKRRGNARFCAYHSYSTCNGVPVQFGFFFNLDGDPGCDPQDANSAIDGHSQGLAALANVSGHELSEARTDPRNGGWYDSSGAENADKCAWTFGTQLLSFSNGTQWKIQGNWSNTAWNKQNGYPNGNGQRGCVDGGNYPAPVKNP